MPESRYHRSIAVLVVAWALSASTSLTAQSRPRSNGNEAPVAQPATDGMGSAAAIDQAIARGKAYLYAQQREGNWEESQKKVAEVRGGPPGGGPGGGPGGRGGNPVAGSQWGGLTSIATFALLASGEGIRDERIAKALSFLKAGDITGTYALGLHAQIWNFIPATSLKEYRANILKDGRTLYGGSQKTGSARGLYHYTPTDGGWDNSTSQFGVVHSIYRLC